MKYLSLFVISTNIVFMSYAQSLFSNGKDVIIANGRMPNITKDKSNNIHIVYGTGDSIMYISSTKEGKSFSLPVFSGGITKGFCYSYAWTTNYFNSKWTYHYRQYYLR
ncbi:MAG: hypothetical protein WKG06_10775 [Segetibacter sp.]